MSEAEASPQNPAGWWVQVRGQAYGPYTMAQMAGFVEEGRIRPATHVSTKRDGDWVEARKIDGLMTPLRATSTFGDITGAEPANVFIFAEIHTGAWNRFLAALEAMGVIADLAPGLWLLRSRLSAGVIRNTLSQTLELGDKFVVIDATRDRFAWFNLGPEVDVHIKKVWNGPLRPDKDAPQVR